MSSVSPELKRMNLHDLAALMAIERQVFHPPSSASVMRDSLLAAHTQVWGLVHPETQELLGFGILSVILDEAELLTLAIAPRYQGHGYGRLLMEFLIDKARLGKAETLYLEVRVSHEVALLLYTKLGFIQVGIRKEYYPRVDSKQREDAVLLSLRLQRTGRIADSGN